jgi:hypothetical protein
MRTQTSRIGKDLPLFVERDALQRDDHDGGEIRASDEDIAELDLGMQFLHAFPAIVLCQNERFGEKKYILR